MQLMTGCLNFTLAVSMVTARTCSMSGVMGRASFTNSLGASACTSRLRQQQQQQQWQ
jgi:hypothetical protein